MKKMLMALMMFGVMAVLVACGGEKEVDKSAEKTADDKPEVEEVKEIEVKHELDKEAVTVPKNPEKVVVFDFGILDTFDTLDIEVAGLPQANVPGYLEKFEDEKYVNVGSLKEPDFEAIHELQPDLIIITGRQSDMYDQFKEIAPTIFVGLDTSDYMVSFKHNMDLVAEIFGKEDEMATELAEIDEQIAAINDKVSAQEETALITLANEGKISAYGPSSRFGLIHDVFGFKPADDKIESSTHGQSITFEYVLETNPGILFVVDRGAAIGGEASANMVENELVMKTDAFENEKIIYLNGEYWYLSGGGLVSVKEMIKEVEQAL